MIELRNLTKRFGTFTAVDNVTLKIEKGEFFGFLGPNGAGKTTTIKMMTGLYRPTSGSSVINGFDIQQAPLRAKRSFGYVPDQPYIYEKLTGREFLYFIGGLYDIDLDLLDEKIDRIERDIRSGQVHRQAGRRVFAGDAAADRPRVGAAARSPGPRD